MILSMTYINADYYCPECGDVQMWVGSPSLPPPTQTYCHCRTDGVQTLPTLCLITRWIEVDPAWRKRVAEMRRLDNGCSGLDFLP